jgi:hypothetical protein
MKRTNLLEYFIEHPQWGKKNTHFDPSIKFCGPFTPFPSYSFCVCISSARECRYICENAVFKDAKRYASVITRASFQFERNRCEMKIRVRDWWFFNLFFLLLVLKYEQEFLFIFARKEHLSLSAVLGGEV